MEAQDALSSYADVLIGTEMLNIMRVDPVTVIEPMKKDQMASIAEFVNKYPDALQNIRQAMRKMPYGSDSIDHIYGYVSLQTKRMSLKDQLASLEREISFYE